MRRGYHQALLVMMYTHDPLSLVQSRRSRMSNARFHTPRVPGGIILVFACMGFMAALPAVAAGTDVTGTFVFKGKTTTLKHAYLVTGPDAVSKQPIRRLILSATDLGGKIAACKTMSCTDSGLDDGLSINLEGGSRFNYWMVQNDQRIQYSGTEPMTSFTVKADDPKRLSGSMRFDKTGAGGPKVDATFDAALAKALTAP
jgi:hypothetical protein